MNVKPNVIRVSALFAAVTLATACGDGDTATGPPPNRAPVGSGTMPAQTITVGETATVNASSYFNDPDGDPLTYTAATSSAAVAGVSVSGSTVMLVAVAAGTATITVTARDPGGLEATQASLVTVESANRAPVASGTIPPRTLTAGETATVNVSSYFTDPDGDALSYGAATSDAAVATASVSGSTVTLVAVAAGTATITVTARDPGGLEATQTSLVTVESANRAPVASGTIPPRTLTTGETATVNATPYFNDPDGDALAYAASSSDPGVASVSVSGSSVRIEAAASGSVTVRITATDPGGLSAEQSFTVTVQSGGGGGGTRTYQTGETVSTLPTGFWTPEVTSRASFQFSSGQVTITFNNGGYIEAAGIRYTCRASGGCRIVNRVVTQGTIEASGGGGGGGSNRAPETAGSISDRTMTAGETSTVDASSYFSDPDGDRLTYTARSSSTSAATVSVSGSEVTVTAVAQGSATVRIAATDPGGLSAEQSFTVTVESGGGGQAATVTLSTCNATPLIPGVPTGTYNVSMTGTVEARRAVTFVTVTGYANGDFVGIDLLGSIAAGQSKNFGITGIWSTSATTVTCRAEAEWRTSGTVAAPASRSQTSTQATMAAPRGYHYDRAEPGA